MTASAQAAPPAVRGGAPVEVILPISNLDIAAAWRYHDATKHSPESIWASVHHLDWPNRPLSYKLYRDLDPTPLPRDMPASELPALLAISDEPSATSAQADLPLLAKLCYFGAGVTKKLGHAGHEMFFRAAACTGALYHIELYLVTSEIPGLPAGVYHFSVHDNSLRRLRAGDFRGVLVEASGAEPATAQAQAVAVLTTTYWRNAWKYQARAYRHAFWDSGTILANILAVSAASHLPARLVLGYADAPVNFLLGLDTEREVSIALVALGAGAADTPAAPEIPPLHLETAPLSRSEVDYPSIRAMHAVSSLLSGAEAAAWRGGAPELAMPPPAGKLVALQPNDDPALAGDPVERVILRRGSSRRFARESITLGQLSNALAHATQGLPADFLDPPGDALNRLYVVAHAVDGLPSGAYVFHRDRQALELLLRGDFRDTAGFLGLGQELPADASADVFFLTDLHAVLGRFGNRGYRAAQIDAGVIGGKLYLGAYAQGIGATGLTFFDDEVTDFFSPHAAGMSVMFLVALGVPYRRRGEEP